MDDNKSEEYEENLKLKYITESYKKYRELFESIDDATRELVLK